MLNTVMLMGRLTKDPEIRRTDSGKSVASFSVAVDRDFAPEGQEKETDFLDCVAWKGTADFIGKYFQKGSMIIVQGRLQKRSWTDKEGNKRYTVEVVANQVWFGESKKSQEGGNTTQGQYGHPGAAGGAGGYQNQHQGYGYQAPRQGYDPNSYERQVNAPQYNQQGFGGYQVQGFQGQVYQPNHPPQGSFAQMTGDDEQLPF